MLLKAVFPGKYIQGEGALSELRPLAGLLGSKGLVLASPTARRSVLPRGGIDLDSPAIAVETFRGECCEGELARVADAIARERADVLVGMGGGKAIDTAKIAADRAGIPVIVVPTIASTDAPCSGCAVIYSEKGEFESVAYQKLNPSAVLVDTRVIADAPPRFLVAGMGDAMATWFEARSCERTASPNECGGLGTMTALAIARLCHETLMKYGVLALSANEAHIVSPALDRIVEANILLSGIGFESSGLASAHSIHNGLTALPETHPFYHGEKVAFGVLAGLFLADADPAEIESILAFCVDVGLPTTLADLGLAGAGRDRLLASAAKACAPAEGIHHEAREVTPGRVLAAMLAADAAGRARKGRSPTR